MDPEFGVSQSHSLMRGVTVYELFVLFVSVYSLAVVCALTFASLDPAIQELLESSDTIICVFFFLDFLHRLYRSEAKLRYLMTYGWLDLLSSIPMVDALRFGRLARVARFLRVLRGIRAARLLLDVILLNRIQSALAFAAALTLLTVTLSSVAILEAERYAGNIQKPGDALWWAIVTMTTVGYGDFYPVTPLGRFVAVITMIVGIGIFSILAGSLAAWLMEGTDRESEMLRARIRELEEELARYRQDRGQAQA